MSAPPIIHQSSDDSPQPSSAIAEHPDTPPPPSAPSVYLGYFYHEDAFVHHQGYSHPRKPFMRAIAHELFLALNGASLAHIYRTPPNPSALTTYHDPAYLGALVALSHPTSPCSGVPAAPVASPALATADLRADRADPPLNALLRYNLADGRAGAALQIPSDNAVGPLAFEAGLAAASASVAAAGALAAGYHVTAAVAGGAVHPWPSEAGRGEFINDTALAVHEMCKFFPRILVFYIGKAPPFALAQAVAQAKRTRVILCSIHGQHSEAPVDDPSYLQMPKYKTTVSLPLRPGAGDELMLTAAEALVKRAIAVYVPSAVLYVGCPDMLASDKQGIWNCTVGGYVAIADMVARQGLPLTYLPGAGWHGAESAKAIACTLVRLSGGPVPTQLPATVFWDRLGSEPNSLKKNQEDENSFEGVSRQLEACFLALSWISSGMVSKNV